jgi:hypothetical protein
MHRALILLSISGLLAYAMAANVPVARSHSEVPVLMLPSGTSS